MPLSQRDQYSDRKGMGLVRLGAVLCLAGFLFGSVCFTIVSVMGQGEDPPKIFEQMGGASCGVFALGMILGIVGWLISLNQPGPPKPTAAASPSLAALEDDEAAKKEAELAEGEEGPSKPDPYASDHRRRDD
ncbi:MAG: hypothetical protein KTR15_13025 [Phycisphaeraceae bacterium]|nr:hypothetical protein [Phycisphaeraceae bacterium]